MNKDIQWMGVIPKQWKIIKGKFIFSERTTKGNTVNSELLSPTQKYGVIPQTLYEKLSTQRTVKIDEEKNLSTFKTIHKGDYCISLRSFQGGIEYCEYEGVVSPAYKVFYPHIEINREYYKFLLKDASFIGKIASYSDSLRDGKSISFEEFGNTFLPVPPIKEQEQIAEFLNSKCSEIDILTSKIKEQITTLEEYKKSIITEAVTRGLNPNVKMKDSGIEWIGEIPEEWETIKGKYAFTERTTKGNRIHLELLSPTQKFGVIPQTMYEELSTQRTVKIDENKDLSQFKTIHKGDYCISLRSFQGGFEYCDYEGVVSPAYKVFFPSICVDRRYYRYLFKEQGFISKIASYSDSLRDGKSISFEEFGKTIIPIPSVEEQQDISDYLDTKCTEIDRAIAEKKEQSEILEKYKKSLIYEYVTGKKEVHN